MGNAMSCGRWFVLGLAVMGLLLGAAACSSDDDGGNSKCDDGCGKAADLCQLSASDKSECISQCNQATQEQIDAAYNCMQEATSCSDAELCVPQ